MDEPMSNLHFKVMTVLLKIRDLLLPRSEILKEVELRGGQVVLDFGCGPGSYSIVAAEMVGASGKVYALDIQPVATEAVHKAAVKKGLKNIETICSDCTTGLEDASVDVILLCDTFHMLSEPKVVLAELHRVLKREGILSFNDHHMKENEIIDSVREGGLFRLAKKGRRTYVFVKARS